MIWNENKDETVGIERIWLNEIGKERIEYVQIVRCKDCKECYFASNRIQSEQTFACGKHGIDVTQDWFCADGVSEEK